MPYTLISLGGVAVGVGIVLMYLIRWWFKEKRQWTALVPFVLSHIYGLLAALATFGAASALGGVTWAVIWAANAAGYLGLVWGVGGNDRDVTRGTPVALTDGVRDRVPVHAGVHCPDQVGAARTERKADRGRVLRHVPGPVWRRGGVAAVPLGSAVNMLGSGFTGALG